MYEEAVKTVTVEKSGYKHTIKLYPDCHAEDPRDWDGHISTFALTHKRYNMANEFNWLNFNDYNSFDEVLEAVKEREKIVAYRWVRGYEHGSLVLSLSAAGQFSCPWDSGWMGFIFVTEESMKENYPTLPRDDWEKTANEAIEAEFKTYNAYVVGDVYCYRITGDLCDDSCCGYYSSEDAISEAESIVDAVVKHKLEEADHGILIHEMLG